MKNRVLGFLLACLMLVGILPMSAAHAVSVPGAPGGVSISYQQSSTVQAGTISYVSQLTASPRFYASYWEPFVDGAGHECYTADISMALSCLGLNATPAAMGTYWNSRGHTGGTPFTTVAWDLGPFGATYLERSFAYAMQCYQNDPTTYSPPIIHLTTYSERGHYVMIAGQISSTQFTVVDPASDSTWTLTIENNVVTYPRKGEMRSETLEPASQFKRTGSTTYVMPNQQPTPAPTPTPTPVVTVTNPGYHSDGLRCASAAMIDVPAESNWAHEGIDYCISHGLMQGTDSKHFSPNQQMTRAMMVTVLYRSAGSPSVSGLPCPFEDLKADWYRAAVTWAYHEGITGGVSAARFAPDDLVSREQLVAMLYRYRQLTSATPARINALDPFRDAHSISSWAEEPMRWAVTSGVLSGTSSTQLSPGGNANRAQMATILMRFESISF